MIRKARKDGLESLKTGGESPTFLAPFIHKEPRVAASDGPAKICTKRNHNTRQRYFVNGEPHLVLLVRFLVKRG